MGAHVICGDCREVLCGLPDGQATLAIVDGPYNLRKADWDKFGSWEEFREFYRPIFAELSRVLRDNCSLYVFGTFESLAELRPELEGLGGGWRFVQTCVWDKGLSAIAGRTNNNIRSHPVRSELCLFYARERVDISALAWDGVTREDNTVREYLYAELERSGVSKIDCNVACGFSPTAGGMASRHYFGHSQWQMPTREHYESLRRLFNERGQQDGEYLRRPWAELDAEYERTKETYRRERAELEQLRYPFNPQMGVTDVWEFPICAGKERVKFDGQTAHVAQKPLALIERIVAASSNEGDLVVDPMCGTGTTGVACKMLGRDFVGIDTDEGYCEIARARIAAVELPGTSKSGRDQFEFTF